MKYLGLLSILAIFIGLCRSKSDHKSSFSKETPDLISKDIKEMLKLVEDEPLEESDEYETLSDEYEGGSGFGSGDEEAAEIFKMQSPGLMKVMGKLVKGLKKDMYLLYQRKYPSLEYNDGDKSSSEETAVESSEETTTERDENQIESDEDGSHKLSGRSPGFLGRCSLFGQHPFLVSHILITLT